MSKNDNSPSWPVDRAEGCGVDEERVLSGWEGNAPIDLVPTDGPVESLGLSLAEAGLVANARAQSLSSISTACIEPNNGNRQGNVVSNYDTNKSENDREHIMNRLTWSRLIGNEAAFRDKAIFWDDGLTRVPPRPAQSGDIVPDDVAAGWRQVGDRTIESPDGVLWVLTPNRRLVPAGSSLEIEFVGRGEVVSQEEWDFEPAGHLEEDGMHFGVNSAILPPGVVMDNRDLFTGDLGMSNAETSTYKSESIALPSSANVTSLDLRNGPSNVDVIYETQGSYTVVGVDGQQNTFNFDSPVIIAAHATDINTEHHNMGPALTKAVNLESFASLRAYIDTTTPVGDTRDLTGLSEVINMVGRGALLGNIRAWFAHGSRHGGSVLGYTKLWLYVNALTIKEKIDSDYQRPNWQFANKPGVVNPIYEDSTIDRSVWDSHHPKIRDGSMGWATCDPGTSQEVAQCMADFYRPFPSFTLTLQAHRVGATPAPLGHVLPGIDAVAFTTRDSFGQRTPQQAGAQTVAGRTTLPTLSDYMTAIRQLAAWRKEDDDNLIGYCIALRLSACKLQDEVVAPDAHTRRWPIWYYGQAGSSLGVFLPPTNTLVAAYVHGSTVRTESNLDLYSRESDWTMRAIHKLTICGIEAYSRVLQTVCVNSDDLDDMINNSVSVRTGTVVMTVGNRVYYGENLKSAVLLYLRRVYGIRNAKEVNDFLMGHRRFAPFFSMRRIAGASRVPLWITAPECAFYRCAARMPWHWEVLLANCRYSTPLVHRLGSVARRSADYVFTVVGQRVGRGVKFACVEQYVDLLVLTQHVVECETLARNGVALRARYTEPENDTVLEAATVPLFGAFMPIANAPSFMSLSRWHKNYDDVAHRAPRYEVALVTNAPLRRNTIAEASRPIEAQGLLLHANLPTAERVEPGEISFPGWDAVPAATGLGHVSLGEDQPVLPVEGNSGGDEAAVSDSARE